MPRRSGPSARANECCAVSGTGSRQKGSSLAAGPGKNAFHRRWPMTWRAWRPTDVKRRRRRRPSRRAAATDAMPISDPAAHGRAFAVLPAGCGLIADLLGSPEPKNWPPFSRAIPGKPPGEAIIGLVAAAADKGRFPYRRARRRPGSSGPRSEKISEGPRVPGVKVIKAFSSPCLLASSTRLCSAMMPFSSSILSDPRMAAHGLPASHTGRTRARPRRRRWPLAVGIRPVFSLRARRLVALGG